MDLYHALNRGVDKRVIFNDDRDRARFVHDMFEFNNVKNAWNAGRRAGQQMIDVGRRSSARLVDIHAWCLMGNHYHLLLSEQAEGGISEFLKRLNGGYAKYFNERHNRVGALFQGKTKRVRIETDAHFLHILHYIHLNPLDFLKETRDWRGLKIRNARVALDHLSGYRWSSYKDYCGVRNFPSVVRTDFFSGVFKDYRRSLQQHIRDIDVSNIETLTLE